VLKFILHDFCIVCTTFHVTNFTMLAVVILEYRNPTIHPMWEDLYAKAAAEKQKKKKN